jgi:hypothetical protein
MLVIQDTINRDANFFAATLRDSTIVRECTVASMELWLRVLHDTVTEEFKSLPIHEVWETIAAAKKYFFALELLEGWFQTWWKALDKDALTTRDMQKLLTPCFMFDHPKAFAYVTSRVAYECAGHIAEINPTRYRDLHLEPKVLRESPMH